MSCQFSVTRHAIRISHSYCKSQLTLFRENEDYLSEEDGASLSSAPEDRKFSPEILKASSEGARKRKRANPTRLPATPENDQDQDPEEFCCYDDGTLPNQEDEESPSPKQFKGQGQGHDLTPERKEVNVNVKTPSDHEDEALDLSPRPDKSPEDGDHIERLQNLPIFSRNEQSSPDSEDFEEGKSDDENGSFSPSSE